MLPKNLLSCLFFFFSGVRASAVNRDTGKATLKFSTGISTAAFSNLAEKDRARAKALTQLPHLSKRSARSRSVSGTNAAVFYTAEVGVGTPPTYRMSVIYPFLRG